MAKCKNRVNVWFGMKLGIAMHVVFFNIYIVRVLEFIAQLCPVDQRVFDAMKWAIRNLVSDPGTWTTLQDIENLKVFGSPTELRTIGDTVKASKLRIAATVAKDLNVLNEEIAHAQATQLWRPFGGWHLK